MAGQRLVAKAAKASVGTRAQSVEVKAAGAKLGRKLKVAVSAGLSVAPPLRRCFSVLLCDAPPSQPPVIAPRNTVIEEDN